MNQPHAEKIKLLILLISLVTLMLNASGRPLNWQVVDEKIVRLPSTPYPVGSFFIQPEFVADLNEDGTEECLVAVNEGIQITDCMSKIHWESPEEWRVTEAQVGDLNRDGKSDVILLVWRSLRSWPVDRFLPYGGRIDLFHDKNGESCQIILFGWSQNEWKELWAGSALARPISEVHVADLTGDGWLDLIALEKPYDTTLNFGALTVWEWLGFGFSLIDRVEGNFSTLAIMSDGSRLWLSSQ